MQPHFDYACSAWNPNLPMKIKRRIQITQKYCMNIFLQLDTLNTYIMKSLNFELVTNDLYRCKQCVISVTSNSLNKQCPNYLNEVFDVATEKKFQLKGSFQKLKCPI